MHSSYFMFAFIYMYIVYCVSGHVVLSLVHANFGPRYSVCVV